MTPEINIKPGSKDPLPAAEQADFLPVDDYNTKLVANGGPKDYVNPEPLEKYDLVRARGLRVRLRVLQHASYCVQRSESHRTNRKSSTALKRSSGVETAKLSAKISSSSRSVLSGCC